MGKGKKCSECDDTGSYKVYNAYAPGESEEVPCEYCEPRKRKQDRLALN